MPFRIVIAAYNSAGERVKLIYEGEAFELFSSLKTSGGGVEFLVIDLLGVLVGIVLFLVWSVLWCFWSVVIL
jgi:hypothetical protein